jgi:hypothetical protein
MNARAVYTASTRVLGSEAASSMASQRAHTNLRARSMRPRVRPLHDQRSPDASVNCSVIALADRLTRLVDHRDQEHSYALFSLVCALGAVLS